MSKTKKKLVSSILVSLSGISYADNKAESSNHLTLSEVQVVANKLAFTNNNQPITQRESGNFIPSLTSKPPIDRIHSTAYDLNTMAGVSILGSSQSISQHISIGGLDNSNIYVSIDDLNNYFSSTGHNQTNQFLSPFLYKQVSASQTGSNITYGSGNVGGAVNFTTLDPEDLLHGDQFSTQASIGGNSATTGTLGNAALAAKTGKVSYLLDVVATNNNDMQLGNNSTLPYSANTNYQMLGKVGVAISNSQKLKFTFLGMQNQGQYPATISNSVTATNPPSNFAFKQSQTSLDYNYDPNLALINLKAKLFYQTNSYNSAPINNGRGFAQAQDITVTTSGLKLQNSSTLIGQKLLYGIDYTNIAGSNAYNSGSLLSFPTASQQLYGAFIQDSWDISNSINVTAGTRYNSFKSSASNLNNSGGLFTNQIGLNYHFLPDWLAFVGYAEGFKAPTIQELYMGGNHPFAGPAPFLTILPNPGLQAEVGHNKTAGLKYATAISDEQYFNAEATVFLNNVSNYILNTYTGQQGRTAVNQNINIPDATLYGYILAAKYTSPWLIIDSNFTCTNGSTQSSYRSPNGQLIGPGSPLPIPQAKGYLGLGFPIQEIDSTLQPMVNYAFNQPMTPVNVPGVNGYVLLGFMYKWQPKNNSVRGLEVSAGIDNILNENYQTFDGLNIYPGMGRNIYGQISYRY